ncbi:hypothetical protein DFS34DRAFT_142442 [Phlyctochytrium arcticum]|nr:hypothetical protein DFS34DRAFT_142442 [Phlyctochytrium arcticum]
MRTEHTKKSLHHCLETFLQRVERNITRIDAIGNKCCNESFVNTSISAIPLSNYTLTSTYNTRQTAIDNRFTPIETRIGQLKALSNLDTIDLSTSLVTGILPISKIDTSTLQPLITSGNAASFKTTLGLSSTASSGNIDWGNVTGKPVFGSLSLKNSIDLSTTEVTGILPISKIDTSELQPLIADYNKDEIRQTLGIEWDTLVGRPTLGSLALKNSIDLSTTEVTGIIPISKVLNGIH